MTNRLGVAAMVVLLFTGPVVVIGTILYMPFVSHAVPLVCADPVVEITAEKVEEPPANATTYDELEIGIIDDGIRRTLRMAAESGAYYRCRYTSDGYGISNGYITLRSSMVDVDPERTFYYEYNSAWYRIQWDIDSRTQ